jgi:hypothetical protein
MHGDGRRDTGHLMDHCGVIEFFARGPGCAGPCKRFEPGAAVCIAPTGRLDALCFECCFDGSDIQSERDDVFAQGGVSTRFGHDPLLLL